MSAVRQRILQAGIALAGGEAQLAAYLNVDEMLVRAYLDDHRPLPDVLLLRVIDLVLKHSKPDVRVDPDIDAVVRIEKRRISGPDPDEGPGPN